MEEMSGGNTSLSKDYNKLNLLDTKELIGKRLRDGHQDSKTALGTHHLKFSGTVDDSASHFFEVILTIALPRTHAESGREIMPGEPCQRLTFLCL